MLKGYCFWIFFPGISLFCAQGTLCDAEDSIWAHYTQGKSIILLLFLAADALVFFFFDALVILNTLYKFFWKSS